MGPPRDRTGKDFRNPGDKGPSAPGPPMPGVGKDRGNATSPSRDGNPSGSESGDDNPPPVDVRARDTTVVYTVSATFPRAVYDIAVDKAVPPGLVWLKNQADTADLKSHIHELAAAVQAYVKEKGTYPRGAVERPPSGERVVDWPPEERFSWLYSVLGYLPGEGRELAAFKVDDTASWKEGRNLPLAQTVVPAFLARSRADGVFLINYSGAALPVAVGQYVGVSGVGPGAADYDPKDSSTKKKLGVFGYDRVTRPDDITDGAENTILALQVPAGPTDQKAPWIAGGGATVRDIREDENCFRPYVCAQRDGKPGTYAIMCDFRVRFIPEDIKPEVFRAMCTIAGGEKIDNLDDLCPVVTGEVTSSKPDKPAEKPDDKPKDQTAKDSKSKPDEAAPSGQTELEGTWDVVSLMEDHKLEHVQKGQKTGLLFKDGKWSQVLPGAEEPQTGTFKIDPTKTPKGITLVHVARDGTREEHAGVFEVKGDDARIYLGLTDRPNDFTPISGHSMLFTLKRSKAQPADKPDPNPKDKGDKTPPTDSAKGDPKALEGSWDVVALVVQGKDFATPDDLKTQYTFKGDKWFKTSGDTVIESGPFAIDPSKTPWTIDLTQQGAKRSITRLGIYEIQGDEMHLYIGTPQERPTEFISKPGVKGGLQTLKRSKTEVVIGDKPDPKKDKGDRTPIDDKPDPKKDKGDRTPLERNGSQAKTLEEAFEGAITIGKESLAEMKKITDKASAEAARPRLATLKAESASFARRVRALTKPGPNKAIEKYEKEFLDLVQQSKAESDRVLAIPGVKDVLGNLLQ
jgi:uncharacterized protein (TIGR03067 family)